MRKTLQGLGRRLVLSKDHWKIALATKKIYLLDYRCEDPAKLCNASFLDADCMNLSKILKRERKSPIESKKNKGDLRGLGARPEKAKGKQGGRNTCSPSAAQASWLQTMDIVR